MLLEQQFKKTNFFVIPLHEKIITYFLLFFFQRS